MAFISKEVPTWAINWVNKVFTVANTISVLDDVWVDWAIYTNITVTAPSTLTLVDAPTISIIVDYYDSPPVNPSTGFLLVSDMRDILVRNLQNNDITDVTDDNFLDFANDLQLDVYATLRKVNWLDYIAEQEITYSTDTVALNSDFLSVDWLDVWLYRVKDWELDYHYPAVQPWSSIKWFNIDWTDLKLIGNFSTWDTLTLRYFTKSNDLNDIADATVIPDDRRLYPSVRNMLRMLYEWWRNDNSQEVRASDKYLQDAWNLSKYLKKQQDTVNLYEI